MKRTGYLEFTKRERTGIISLVSILIVTAVAPEFFCGIEKLPPHLSIESVDPGNSDQQKNDVRVFDTSRRESHRDHSTKKYSLPGMKNYAWNKDAQQRIKFDGKKRKTIQVVEINSADTNAFIALPGIGSRLASRIVSFREKLGGFYDVRQIGEVYGLQDSVFRKLMPLLTCDTATVRKINVNSADREILKGHPYIRWGIANALVSYRNEHGAFTSVGDLTKLENIDDAALKKMLPYLSFK